MHLTMKSFNFFFGRYGYLYSVIARRSTLLPLQSLQVKIHNLCLIPGRLGADYLQFMLCG